MQDLKSRNTFENDMRLPVVISSSSQLLSITPLKYRDFLEKCAREYTVFLLTNLPAEMPKLSSFSTGFRTHSTPYRADFCNFLQLEYRHAEGASRRSMREREAYRYSVYSIPSPQLSEQAIPIVSLLELLEIGDFLRIPIGVEGFLDGERRDDEIRSTDDGDLIAFGHHHRYIE